MHIPREQLWPIRPKPIAGEVLSSWLSRIAYENGLTFNELRKLLPKEPGNGLDFDRISSKSFFETLSSATGVPEEAIMIAGYGMDQGRVFDNHVSENPDWLLPLVRIGQQLRTISMPFCPACFASDSTRFYRKNWRYAFHPVCAHHGLLQEECTECGIPYSHLEADKKGQMILNSGRIGECRHCGTRIGGETTAGLANPTVASVVGIQAKILSGIDNGWIDVEGTGLVHIIPFLKGLRTITTMVMHPVIGSEISQWCTTELNPTLSLTDDRRNPRAIEKAAPLLRAQVLRIADALIQEWPNRLIALMDQLGLPLHKTMPSFTNQPFWIVGSDIAMLRKNTTRILSEELDSARDFLAQKRNWAPSASDLQRFVTTGIVPPIQPLTRPASESSKKLLQELARRNKAWKDSAISTHAAPRTYPDRSIPSIATAELLGGLNDGTERLSALQILNRERRSKPDD